MQSDRPFDLQTTEHLHRIEVYQHFEDSVAEALFSKLRREAPELQGLRRIDVYTLAADLEAADLQALADVLAHPVSRAVRVDAPLLTEGFDWALETGFLPGVTDNVARTVGKMLADGLGRPLQATESMHSSRLLLLRGPLSEDQRKRLEPLAANPLVEWLEWKSAEQYALDGGMSRKAPQVRLTSRPVADRVDLELPPEELAWLGRKGIPELEGQRGERIARRGPLALDLDAMEVIRDHFRGLGRKPTDVELESIAQNWSEHCRHLIFNSPIDELDAGLFRHYIRGATETIRAARGAEDPCVSVFKDNAGAIVFDEDWLVTDKVETHNSPSALDPFGGALTGILGVNRDALGFGLGALPILNRYGFCLPPVSDRRRLFRSVGLQGPLLPPELLAEGIFQGVQVGGNCCGIPTPQGFRLFHEGFRAKPLVFVGTLGLIPRQGQGRELWRKAARPGDRIVMVGGRVGLDGIHGATFSSEALASGSPATAVQIGDPIGQKLLLDALVHEARDRALYTSLTDNGAGGLSCSIPEMAREAGGCRVQLDRVPLKYPGMAPWQVWISESQERMTLAVPPENLQELLDLFARRDVEATDVGEFTEGNRCVVLAHGEVVLDLELDFLLDGWPAKRLFSRPPGSEPMPVPSVPDLPPTTPDHVWIPSEAPVQGATAAVQPDPQDAGFPAASLPPLQYFREAVTRSELYGVALPVGWQQAAQRKSTPRGLRARLLELLSSPSLASREDLALRFDHEVQGSSILKPLVGRGRVDADATAVRPLAHSWRGVAVSQGLCPEWTEIAPYRMACWAVDAAVRPLIAVGARPKDIALLDNFCWCSPQDPVRLWQLKEACRGCHDIAVAYGTPFISGKDSMHNDFRGYDDSGNPVALSIPPTLLISSLAVVPDVRRLVTLEAKAPGDAVFLLGETRSEPGVPPLDAAQALQVYEAHARAVESGLLASSIALGAGGLPVAAARSALAGGLGLELQVEGLDLESLSPARLLVTCADADRAALQSQFQQAGIPFQPLGTVTEAPFLVLGDVRIGLDELEAAYRTDWRRIP